MTEWETFKRELLLDPEVKQIYLEKCKSKSQCILIENDSGMFIIPIIEKFAYEIKS